MSTLAPSALALPSSLATMIPPRPPGWGMTRELFLRNTGGAFDLVTPAVSAADMTISMLLDDSRAARLVEQKAIDPTEPGLEDVLEAIHTATFGATTRSAYEAEIKRATERVFVDELMNLANGAPMPQARALATLYLQRIASQQSSSAAAPVIDQAQAALLTNDIKRFMDRPHTNADIRQSPTAPPGAPIGDMGMDWLSRVARYCDWQYIIFDR
jgi:hypothetical protein